MAEKNKEIIAGIDDFLNEEYHFGCAGSKLGLYVKTGEDDTGPAVADSVPTGFKRETSTLWQELARGEKCRGLLHYPRTLVAVKSTVASCNRLELTRVKPGRSPAIDAWLRKMEVWPGIRRCVPKGALSRRFCRKRPTDATSSTPLQE